MDKNNNNHQITCGEKYLEVAFLEKDIEKKHLIKHIISKMPNSVVYTGMVFAPFVCMGENLVIAREEYQTLCAIAAKRI